MSRGIDTPENRPAMAWVLGLDKSWTTFAERCLLLVLAADSHDGYTCSPTREEVMRAAGMWASQYYPAVASLTTANDKRPALLAVEPHGRYRRNTYRLLRSPESATPDRSPESATPDRDGAGVQSRSPEQESRAGVQSRSPESATHTTPSPPDPEGGREGGGAGTPAPDGAARPPESLVAVVMAVLRQRWPGETPVVSNLSRQLLARLVADGWTEAAVAAAVNTIGKNPRNPRALLEAHLKRVHAEHTPGDYDTGPWDADDHLEVDQADDGPPTTCDHGQRLGAPVGNCPACNEIVRTMQRTLDAAKTAGFVLTRDHDGDDKFEYTLERPWVAGVMWSQYRGGHFEDPSDVFIWATDPTGDQQTALRLLGDVERVDGPDEFGRHRTEYQVSQTVKPPYLPGLIREVVDTFTHQRQDTTA